jgi:clan AA aspartic protease (TIGR02281 family)
LSPLAGSDRVVGRREYGGVLVIPAQVGEHWVRLLVDTGCTVTALTRRALERLELDQTQFTGRRVVFTAAGTLTTVPTGHIDRLKLSGNDVRHVEVALVDLPASINIDGLLGVNVLDRFRTTFEFRSATLVMRPERTR